jgi:outer membrane protein W
VYPKFAIGLTSLFTDKNSVKLKEPNSNNEYEVSFSSKKSTNNYFTLAPSVSFGYKIFKRIYLNADIALSYFKTDIELKKDFRNLYTNESVVEYFDYKNDVLTLSLSAGLIFVIN